MYKPGILLSISGCLLISAAAAQDVYIDLSVLDEIGDGYSESHEPLFTDDSSLQPLPRPVVSRSVKKVPPKPAVRPAKTIAAQQKIAPAAQTAVQKAVSLPEAKPLRKRIPDERGIKVLQKTPVPAAAEEKALQPQLPEAADISAALASASAGQTVSVSVPAETFGPEEATMSTEMPLLKQPVASPRQQKTLNQSVVKKLSSTGKAKVSVMPDTVAEVLEPLIPVNDTDAAANTVLFASGSSELSSESLKKLAEMTAVLQQPGSSKIIISAFNYDSGENSFKSKRLSLDRAVAVRSCLMTRGYTSFSIKIINTDNRLRENTVEVTEQPD